VNQLRVIRPYRIGNTWVFDDPSVGLHQEALVAGMPEIIVAATRNAGIKNPENGFNVIFSHEPFPGYQLRLDKDGTEHGGTWYLWWETQMRGWLCPALFKYFPSAPSSIYCQVSQ